MPTRSSAARASLFQLARLPPKTFPPPAARSPKQVSQGSSEWFWNTTRARGRGGGSPVAVADQPPPVGVSRPAIRFSSVDLPQPECPIRVMNSPLGDLEVDVPQRMEAALAGVEHHFGFGDVDEAAVMGSVLRKRETLGQLTSAVQQQADDADTKMAMMMWATLRLFHRPRPRSRSHAAGQHLGGDDHEPGRPDGGAHRSAHRAARRQQHLGDDLPLAERFSTRATF